MEKDRNLICYTVGAAGLIMIAYLMDLLSGMTASVVMQAFMRGIRSVIHISLLISWCVSLQRMIINPQVRRSIVAVGVLLAFWLTAKVIKYEFISDRTFWLGRYIWYSYYIPMILVPLIGVFIIDHMGKPEGHRNPRWMKMLSIPAFAILLGIFTNDLHQLAFHFPDGTELYDYEYGYGPIYFAAMAWFVVLGIYFVIMLLRKCRVPGSKGMQTLPAVIMGGAVIFWTLYCLGIFRNADLTVVDCLIISLLLESAIQSGLIPSNTNYDAMFRASSIAAQIVDRDGQPCFTSASAMPMTRDVGKYIDEQPVKVGHKILHAKSIKGGYVLWQDDVTVLDELMAQLQDAQRQLSKENELLRSELKLKEQQAKVEEKTRLYDQIAKDVAPQLEKMDALLAQSSDPLVVHSAMAKMCVIGSYVKRRSNLLLLGEDKRTVPAKELEYCIRESLGNLQLASVSAMLNAQCDGDLPPAYLIAAYDFYESLVERLLDRISAMMVRLTCENGAMKMRLQIGCVTTIPEQLLEDLRLRFGSFTYTLQDEDVMLDLEICEGGACI